MTQVGLNPNYSVKFYRDGFYKLVRFNRPLVPHLIEDRAGERDSDSFPDGKFSQAVSRARSVVSQVVLCNDWDYFITCTIDSAKYDRRDLSTFYTSFSQWIRDQRKKYGINIRYMFIPELHKDGAWHMHGVISGIPDSLLSPFIAGIHPRKLVDNGFLNWPGYSEKFGFCSLAPIRDPIAVGFYVTKYISKDMASAVSDFGAHTYYCSIGLARALPMGYVYGRFVALDRYIVNDGQFCGTGFVTDVDWSFWMDYLPVDSEFDNSVYPEEEAVGPVLTNVPDLQLSLYDLIPNFAG